ncbi:uncharacterized protein LOC116188293 isoform X2 [Punica granatum]|uniref:Uncharacterized protein LOC116188293 isoform X2 n=1 Tax=Punica granatum TaxID=22663 RepID=A0A6P8BVV3_PUNGR|nr:uncharacterized protein LOC116188293 isoform X2 [Punica granatum]
MRTRRLSVVPVPPETPQPGQRNSSSSSEPSSPSSPSSPLSVEAISALQLESNGGTKRKRGRGPTLMRDLWGLQDDERKVVSFNSFGQPNDPENSSKLANFLGTIARDGTHAPLHYLTWRKMPGHHKEEMVKLVKLKFEIPAGDEDFILRSISKKWRNWKSTVKKMYFDPMLSVEEQLQNVPDRVEADQWKELLTYWSSEVGKDASKRNKEIRKRQKMVHRMGTRSFAVIREITEKMKEILAQDAQGSTSVDGNDVYTKVMGKDKPGFLRIYGLGVSDSDVRGSMPSRSKCYTMAMKYKSALESIERQYGELNKKLEVLQSRENSGNPANSGVQTASMNHQNHFLASTSDSRALQVPISCEAFWSSQLVEVFCKLCIERIDRGQCPGTQFTEKMWEIIASKFEVQTGRKYDKDQLQSKWNSLKGEWEKWKQLIDGETELGWDSQKKTVNATDEWWVRKIQLNPEFRSFRTEGIPPDLEVLLDRMFMNVVSTGYIPWVPSQDTPPNFNDDDMSNYNDEDMSNYNDVVPSDSGDDNLNDNKDVGESIGELGSKKAKKQVELNRLSSRLKGKKKKKKKLQGTSKRSKQLDRLYSAVESKSIIPSQIPPEPLDPSHVTYSEIMEMLGTMPEIEQNDELHFFALDHLKDRLNQMIFKNLKSSEKRVNWLKHEFKKQNHR